ncbi:MAG: Neutral/alkaline non-lysosomal ceramidase [Firmicutes bacterium ADurb.Bin300]|nr:MAG: Neutral/alkaline non-lysosomal ceramidase [Firmicutes bacterium ADurb.Bin300]
MKKTIKSFLAIALTFCLLFSIGLSPAYAAGVKERENVYDGISLQEYLSLSRQRSASSFMLNTKQTLSKVINFISNLLLNGVLFRAIADFFPQASNTAVVSSLDSFDITTYENFYSGTQDFIDEKAAGASWSLGYAEESILPDDFGTGLYARGSYVPWWYSKEMYTDEDGNLEELRVRTVILDDGSGRGKVAFCVLDCIGIANADVRKIRAAIADFAAENNIVSINVSATHTHSGIDSQGAWSNPLTTVANNYLSASNDAIELRYGIDPDFLTSVIDGCVNSIINAFDDMKEGTMSFAKADISDYLHDRTPPYAYDGNLYRLKFIPYAEVARPTIIATFGCHPESSSYDFLKTDDGIEIDTKISADFVYYMEKVINKAGYNFIYIQGNVGTVTSSRSLSNDGLQNMSAHDGAIRYGYELGYITLALTMTLDQCKQLNNNTGDLLGIGMYSGGEGYTPWYDAHEAVSEVEVEPILNIAHDQFLIEVENNVALALSKAAVASVNLFYNEENNKYYTVTEVGYLEIGDVIKAYMSPGETYGEILVGGAGIEGFDFASLREMYGENIIILDLMNDAAGYVTPDNHYVIAGYRYNEESDSLESDTWCMMVSFGKNTASTLLSRFAGLVENSKQ